MSVKGKAYMVGVWEHPLRDIPHLSTAQVHAECAKGALEDAGLSFDDVDAYFCAGDAPGFGALSMADYMGLKLKHTDSTETGGFVLLHRPRRPCRRGDRDRQVQGGADHPGRSAARLAQRTWRCGDAHRSLPHGAPGRRRRRHQ